MSALAAEVWVQTAAAACDQSMQNAVSL
jgi:hypothetical protein